MDKYSGSGIIPIIKDKNNIYHMVLFVSSIRNKQYPTLEDAGGCYEGINIKISAIRELKEECCVDGVQPRLVTVAGNPERDPRKHIVTIVYAV